MDDRMATSSRPDPRHDDPRDAGGPVPRWYSWDSPVGLGLFLVLVSLASVVAWRGLH
jgi:hypothetical protein